MVESRLHVAEARLVERGLAAVGWPGPFSVVTKLTGGGSRSQVFLLELDDVRVVLKVTEDAGWHERATRELAVYRELAGALHDFLPVLVAAHHDQHAVRMLLAAHQPYPPSPALTAGAWVELADQLGRLHHVPVSRPGWLRLRPWPSTAEVATALRLWAGQGFAALASKAAVQLAATRDLHAGMSIVLTHGDCHVGNVLQGAGGSAVWADWQEVCLSTGLDDLVFLWQRAEFDGADPPRDAMTRAYAGARSLSPDGDFCSAIAACELRLLLVAWPFFLAYGRKDRRQAMTRRLQQLVDAGVGT